MNGTTKQILEAGDKRTVVDALLLRRGRGVIVWIGVIRLSDVLSPASTTQGKPAHLVHLETDGKNGMAQTREG